MWRDGGCNEADPQETRDVYRPRFADLFDYEIPRALPFQASLRLEYLVHMHMYSPI